jgi:hypothetical protein
VGAAMPSSGCGSTRGGRLSQLPEEERFGSSSRVNAPRRYRACEGRRPDIASPSVQIYWLGGGQIIVNNALILVMTAWQ